jgi:hypothetical protein
MKERPILFSGEMVRAILDGRKTQTRRVMKYPGRPDRPADIQHREPGDKWYKDSVWSMRTKTGSWGDYTQEQFMSKCPYGQPGDRLWVRETWWFGDVIDGVTGNQVENVVLYKADGVRNPVVDKWHPSIHMFREYSRINLEITNIRVERLQNITAEDCIAEGIKIEAYKGSHHAQIAFWTLWDKINSKRGYGSDKDPWVWVVEFRRIS